MMSTKVVIGANAVTKDCIVYHLDDIHSTTTPVQFPSIVVIVAVENLSFTLRGRGVAYVVDAENLRLIRAAESSLITKAIHGREQQCDNEANMGGEIANNLIYLSSVKEVMCASIDGMTTQVRDSQNLGVTSGKVQLIGRLTNAWGYEDGEGRFHSGMSWDVDRFYITTM